MIIVISFACILMSEFFLEGRSIIYKTADFYLKAHVFL